MLSFGKSSQFQLAGFCDFNVKLCFSRPHQGHGEDTPGYRKRPRQPGRDCPQTGSWKGNGQTISYICNHLFDATDSQEHGQCMDRCTSSERLWLVKNPSGSMSLVICRKMTNC